MQKYENLIDINTNSFSTPINQKKYLFLQRFFNNDN